MARHVYNNSDKDVRIYMIPDRHGTGKQSARLARGCIQQDLSQGETGLIGTNFRLDVF